MVMPATRQCWWGQLDSVVNVEPVPVSVDGELLRVNDLSRHTEKLTHDRTSATSWLTRHRLATANVDGSTLRSFLAESTTFDLTTCHWRAYCVRGRNESSALITKELFIYKRQYYNSYRLRFTKWIIKNNYLYVVVGKYHCSLYSPVTE